MGHAGNGEDDGDSRGVMKTTALLLSSLLVMALSGCSSVSPANRQQASQRKQLRKTQHDQRKQMVKAINEKNRVLRHSMEPGPQTISMTVEETGTSSSASGQN
jgi:hypothetical protein